MGPKKKQALKASKPRALKAPNAPAAAPARKIRKSKASQADEAMTKVRGILETERNGALLNQLVQLITDKNIVHKMSKQNAKDIKSTFSDLVWKDEEYRHVRRHVVSEINRQIRRKEIADEEHPMDLDEHQYTIRDEPTIHRAFLSLASQYDGPRNQTLDEWWEETLLVMERRPACTNSFYTKDFLHELNKVMLLVEKIHFSKVNDYETRATRLTEQRPPATPFTEPDVPYDEAHDADLTAKRARIIAERNNELREIEEDFDSETKFDADKILVWDLKRITQRGDKEIESAFQHILDYKVMEELDDEEKTKVLDLVKASVHCKMHILETPYTEDFLSAILQQLKNGIKYLWLQAYKDDPTETYKELEVDEDAPIAYTDCAGAKWNRDTYRKEIKDKAKERVNRLQRKLDAEDPFTNDGTEGQAVLRDQSETKRAFDFILKALSEQILNEQIIWTEGSDKFHLEVHQVLKHKLNILHSPYTASFLSGVMKVILLVFEKRYFYKIVDFLDDDNNHMDTFGFKFFKKVGVDVSPADKDARFEDLPTAYNNKEHERTVKEALLKIVPETVATQAEASGSNSTVPELIVPDAQGAQHVLVSEPTGQPSKSIESPESVPEAVSIQPSQSGVSQSLPLIPQAEISQPTVNTILTASDSQPPQVGPSTAISTPVPAQSMPLIPQAEISQPTVNTISTASNSQSPQVEASTILSIPLPSFPSVPPQPRAPVHISQEQLEMVKKKLRNTVKTDIKHQNLRKLELDHSAMSKTAILKLLREEKSVSSSTIHVFATTVLEICEQVSLFNCYQSIRHAMANTKIEYVEESEKLKSDELETHRIYTCFRNNVSGSAWVPIMKTVGEYRLHVLICKADQDDEKQEQNSEQPSGSAGEHGSAPLTPDDTTPAPVKKKPRGNPKYTKRSKIYDMLVRLENPSQYHKLSDKEKEAKKKAWTNRKSHGSKYQELVSVLDLGIVMIIHNLKTSEYKGNIAGVPLAILRTAAKILQGSAHGNALCELFHIAGAKVGLIVDGSTGEGNICLSQLRDFQKDHEALIYSCNPRTLWNLPVDTKSTDPIVPFAKVFSKRFFHRSTSSPGTNNGPLLSIDSLASLRKGCEVDYQLVIYAINALIQPEQKILLVDVERFLPASKRRQFHPFDFDWIIMPLIYDGIMMLTLVEDPTGEAPRVVGIYDPLPSNRATPGRLQWTLMQLEYWLTGSTSVLKSPLELSQDLRNLNTEDHMKLGIDSGLLVIDFARMFLQSPDDVYASPFKPIANKNKREEVADLCVKKAFQIDDHLKQAATSSNNTVMDSAGNGKGKGKAKQAIESVDVEMESAEEGQVEAEDMPATRGSLDIGMGPAEKA